MYSRNYPYNSPLFPHQNRQGNNNVVSRELALKIAQERDLLYEEVQRLQQAYKQSLAQQKVMERQIKEHMALQEARLQKQAAHIEELEQELLEANRQKEAAEYTSKLLTDLAAKAQENQELVTVQDRDSPQTYVFGEHKQEHEDDEDDEDDEDYKNSIPEKEAEELQPNKDQDDALIMSMLTLRDSLERASSMTQDENNPWKQGLEHMINQFDETLESHGWLKLAQPDDAFNPEVHEAIGTVDTTEEDHNNTIQKVSRQGFVNEATGAIVRPAQVIVNKFK